MTISLAAPEAIREVSAPATEAHASSVLIFGKETETNWALAAAFAELGHRAQLVDAAEPQRVRRGDVAVGRFDVLPTLDGIEPGLWRLARLDCMSSK